MLAHLPQSRAADLSRRTRIGGFLLLGAVVAGLAGTLVAGTVTPLGLRGPDGIAAFTLMDNRAAESVAAWADAVAGALGTVAALCLALGRDDSGAAPAWLAAAPGFLITAALGAFRATGYLDLAASFPFDRGAFAAARDTTLSLGTIGALLAGAGVLGALVAETRRGTHVPAWWSALGALACAIVLTGVVLRPWEATAQVGALLGYAAYPMAILLLPFALRMAWPTLDFGWSRHPAPGPRTERQRNDP